MANSGRIAGSFTEVGITPPAADAKGRIAASLGEVGITLPTAEYGVQAFFIMAEVFVEAPGFAPHTDQIQGSRISTKD